jgi:hypothetical protein
MQGEDMKTATLVALVSSVLQVLMQMLYLCLEVFHFQVDDYHVIRILAVATRCLLVLFTGSIAYFFFFFHKRMIGHGPAKASEGSWLPRFFKR